MTAESNWYRNDALLLGALKQSGRPTRGLPVIPGYDELREISRGGQGVVFNAIQRSTRRNVAIKVLLDGAWASESRRRRFEREVELIASLHHPNIVRLYDSGVTDAGYPYYVMEFVDGVGLDKLVGDGAWSYTTPPEAVCGTASATRVAPDASGFKPVLPLRAALELFAKICDAVHYAHQHGVIHRDLKPSNVRVDVEGEPHVLDFGLAKAAATGDGRSATQMSHTGEFMGSLFWASPEQAEGHPHGTDLRTDVYSLGVVLFQLLTGRFPYPVSGSFREVLDHIQRTPPQRPSMYRKDVDDELDTITLKCLAKEPERRYQSVGELAGDIRHYLAGEPIAAKRDSALYTLRKTMRRYRTGLRVMCLMVILALGATAQMSVLWVRAKEAEQLANQQRDAAELARQTADLARQQALRESANAQLISRFLINMLTTPLDRGREARVADALDQAVAEISQSSGLEPAAEGALRQALGNAYASLGLYDQAEPLLRGALETFRRLGGEESPDALEALSSYAWLRRQSGQPAEAEVMLRKVLDSRRRLLGEENVSTARSMNDLAFVLEQQGQFEEAEALQRKALASTRRLQGDDALDTITVLGNLGRLLMSQGRLEEAAALLGERLATARRVLGSEHRDTVRAMSTYSRLLGQLGKYDQATELSREVLEANRRLLGPDHPETIVAQANLGIGLSALGALDEAEPILQETLARAQRVLGAEHPDTLTVLSSLATVVMAKGRYAEAEALLRQAVEVSARLRGAEHIDTLYFMNALAKCLLSQERHEQAEELLRTVVAGCRRSVGEEHPYTITATLNLGAALTERHQFDQAEPLIRSVIAARQRLLGDDHIETLAARLQLAILHYEQEAYGPAAQELVPLLDATGQALPAGHWFAATVRGWYGRVLLRQQRYDAAEAELLAAYEQMRAALGSSNPRTRKLLKSVVELYEAWGRPTQAERYRAELTDADTSPDPGAEGR